MKGRNFSDVLVIGGCGFVGSHLCEALVPLAKSVTSYDNYFTGSIENHIKNVDYIHAETAHILDYKFSKKFSHIYHLGEYSRVEQSFEDIDKVFEYNHKPIYNILKFAKENNSKIIYSGSSTKFGDQETNAYKSPYAFTKKANAELVITYCEWFNLEYAITYFYNVYGNREISTGKYATLIAKFKKMVADGESYLPVVEPGTQKRNFTHINDIISGLIVVGSKGHGDGFGIGANESYSVLEIVDILNKKPYFLPERKGNRMSAPVITEKTQKLGWTQRHFLIDYLNSH